VAVEVGAGGTGGYTVLHYGIRMAVFVNLSHFLTLFLLENVSCFTKILESNLIQKNVFDQNHNEYFQSRTQILSRVSNMK